MGRNTKKVRFSLLCWLLFLTPVCVQAACKKTYIIAVDGLRGNYIGMSYNGGAFCGM